MGESARQVSASVAKSTPATVKVPPPQVVTLAEFNNHGPAKWVEQVKGNQMGVHPAGNLPFVNTVEIIFDLDAAAAKKRRLTRFRCRQKVCSQELWERDLRDGQFTPWTLVSSTGEEPNDDPDPLLQHSSPKVIAYHDAPGFMGTVHSNTLVGPGGKTTSPDAVMVYLRQNFAGWIEGAIGNGPWKSVSDELKWHSNQHILRALWNPRDWVAQDVGSEIDRGHTHGVPVLPI